MRARWFPCETLAWFCAAADRRVRDRASKALTLLLSVDTNQASRLVERFEGVDDEYIKERVLQATYSAYLLNPSNRAAFIDALSEAISPGFDTQNVLIRDFIRLLADALV